MVADEHDVAGVDREDRAFGRVAGLEVHGVVAGGQVHDAAAGRLGGTQRVADGHRVVGRAVAGGAVALDVEDRLGRVQLAGCGKRRRGQRTVVKRQRREQVAGLERLDSVRAGPQAAWERRLADERRLVEELRLVESESAARSNNGLACAADGLVCAAEDCGKNHMVYSLRESGDEVLTHGCPKITSRGLTASALHRMQAEPNCRVSPSVQANGRQTCANPSVST